MARVRRGAEGRYFEARMEERRSQRRPLEPLGKANGAVPPADEIDQALASSAEQGEEQALVEAWDRNVVEALRAVEPPASLRERVLARLANAAPPSAAPVTRIGWSRRRTAGAIIGALAASLAIATVYFAWPSQSWSDAEVASKAIELWRLDLAEGAIEWGTGEDWPIGFSPTDCRGARVVDFLGVPCRAYQFVSDDRWVLLIMAPKSRVPESFNDYVAPDSTAGLTIRSFENGDFVCIAVYNGDDSTLERFRSHSFT
jgi:hypothetical protein